jgi:hypothetical protein
VNGGQSEQGPDSQAPPPNQEQQRGQAQEQGDAGQGNRGQNLEAVAMFFRGMVDNIDGRIEPEGEKAEIDDQRMRRRRLSSRQIELTSKMSFPLR